MIHEFYLFLYPKQFDQSDTVHVDKDGHESEEGEVISERISSTRNLLL